MAHFAQLDENNIVVNVSYCDDSWDKQEEALSLQTGLNLKQTSYNTFQGVHYDENRKPDGGKALRGNYAGIGYIYDPSLDAFLPPQPNNTILNPVLFRYEANWVALPNGTFWAMLYKNASSSISSAIAQQLYNIDNPGLSNPNRRHLNMVGAPTGPAYAVIRDPIDRFCSAFAMNNPYKRDLPVDDFINWLIQQVPLSVDLHFRPQTTVLGTVENINYFDLKKDLSPLATALGLTSPLPVVNEASNPKPILTSDQIAKLQQYYATDVELYNNISST